MPSAFEASLQLSQALQRLVSLVVRERPRDISLTAFSTLATLDRAGPRRLTQLALSEGVAQPSMTKLVAQLEGLGLVERAQDPDDGRVVIVTITAEGRSFLRAGRGRVSTLIASLVPRLSSHDVAALELAVPALNHLLDVADAAVTSHAPPSGLQLRR